MTRHTLENDPLALYREGLSTTPKGRHGAHPCPLEATAIDVSLRRGFATVVTRRTFRNSETVSIEATLTFPLPVDAVLHGLTVEIDGRSLVAVAEAREKARATYETAIDAGKTAILHEEVLRGVHMVSVGQLAPGASCTVTDTWSTITVAAAQTRVLRIPTTVGAVYGRLPVNPADDLLPGHATRTASLRVRTDTGAATVLGTPLGSAGPVQEGEVDLGHAIDIVVAGASLGPIAGRSAGRDVVIEIAAAPLGSAKLDVAILFDRSGSTAESIRADGSATVWSAMREALQTMLQGFRAADSVSLYAFDTVPELVGRATGATAAALTAELGGPRGGTEIGLAIDLALANGATDILLLTDGMSGALDVHRLALAGARISALLVGPASLEAMVGHLVASTGGQIACASGAFATEHLASLAAALRTPRRHRAPALDTGHGPLPDRIEDVRGASTVTATWSDGPERPLDAVGAYAAALAVPRMTKEAAMACALAHGLCTHLTSLIVVDAAGVAQDTIPEARKVPLPRAYQHSVAAMPAPMQAYPVQASSMRAAPMAGSGLPDLGAPPAPAARAAPERESAPTAPSGSRSFRPRASVRSLLGRLLDGKPFGRPGSHHPAGSSRPGDAATPRHKAPDGTPAVGVTGTDLAAAGRRIDWSAQAGALAIGRLDGLDAASRDALAAAAKQPVIATCAATLATAAPQRDAERLAITIAAALAAVAAASQDRFALRLVRRVRADIGRLEFERLLAVFGLAAPSA